MMYNAPYTCNVIIIMIKTTCTCTSLVGEALTGSSFNLLSLTGLVNFDLAPPLGGANPFSRRGCATLLTMCSPSSKGIGLIDFSLSLTV